MIIPLLFKPPCFIFMEGLEIELQADWVSLKSTLRFDEKKTFQWNLSISLRQFSKNHLHIILHFVLAKIYLKLNKFNDFASNMLFYFVISTQNEEKCVYIFDDFYFIKKLCK
jgi:hypothetical protein